MHGHTPLSVWSVERGRGSMEEAYQDLDWAGTGYLDSPSESLKPWCPCSIELCVVGGERKNASQKNPPLPAATARAPPGGRRASGGREIAGAGEGRGETRHDVTSSHSSGAVRSPPGRADLSPSARPEPWELIDHGGAAAGRRDGRWPFGANTDGDQAQRKREQWRGEQIETVKGDGTVDGGFIYTGR